MRQAFCFIAVTALRAEELQQPQHIMIDQVKPREDVVETALGPGDSLQAFLPVAGEKVRSKTTRMRVPLRLFAIGRGARPRWFS